VIYGFSGTYFHFHFLCIKQDLSKANAGIPKIPTILKPFKYVAKIRQIYNILIIGYF